MTDQTHPGRSPEVELSTIDDVVAALERIDASPRSRGSSWSARCPHPDHQDDTASLSLSVGESRPWVMFCFGCTPGGKPERKKWLDAVLARLRSGDALPPASPSSRRTGQASAGGHGRPTAVYAYTPDVEKVRLVTDEGRKSFIWRRRIGDHFADGLGHMLMVDLPLYGVASLDEYPGTAFVVEGEKDADRLHDLGHAAVSAAGGANKDPDAVKRKLPKDLEPLRDRDVVIIQDRDEAGNGYAVGFMQALQGIAGAVRVARSTLEHKGADVSDHLDAGLTLADLEYAPMENANALATPKPATGDAFFAKDSGLQVASLAAAVKGRVTHGRGGDGRLWIYESGVWRPDDQDHIASTVAAFLGQRYRHGHLTNVQDVLTFDQSSPRINADPVPALINVPNGLFEWPTGHLAAHDPAVLSTVQLTTEYQPDARCPEFDEFLWQVLPADCLQPTPDSRYGFIWELIGYLMMSGNPLQVAILLFGSGRNGKGTLLRVFEALLGPENISSVTLHELVNSRFRSATLYGRIANIAGDLDSTALKSTALFKAITGGDPIQGEYKHGRIFDFTPWAVQVFSANKAFSTPDSSEGYFARWIVVPFPNSFLGHEDRDLVSRLTAPAELEGILARALQALPDLMARGQLPAPPSILTARQAFTIASDPVRAWIDDRVDLCDTFTLRTELSTDYKAWCDRNDVPTVSAQDLYASLETVGSVRHGAIGGHRGFHGLRLRDAEGGHDE